jgi:hypothetical protein
LILLQKDYELLQQSCSRYQDEIGHISTEAARLRIDREDMKEEQVSYNSGIVVTVCYCSGCGDN